jgi:serine/threonine protein phosphatase PrpC
VPDFEEVEVDEKVLYMIVASDGLWDVCEDQQAVEMCRECGDAREMAKKLVEFAMVSGSRDNTSVLVLKF